MNAKIEIKFTQEDQEEHALSKGFLQDYYKTIEVKYEINLLFTINLFFELCVLNTGEIIGEEELISGKPRQFSFYCTSNKGSLFFFNKKVHYF